jgi:lysyl-tRNA synthetase class 2
LPNDYINRKKGVISMSQNIKQLMKVRREKRQFIEDQGIDPYGGGIDFTVTKFIHQSLTINSLTEERVGLPVFARGRVVQMRKMGKSAFAHLLDECGKFQIYAQRDILGEEPYALFKKMDIGDIIEVEGEMFITQSGENTVRVERFSVLSKALRPLPDKHDGIKNVELRYRQRYLDLISSPESRERFVKRSMIITAIRRFLDECAFMEVETPMLHPIAGGATAKPFETHYNALDEDVFLRIAPELYLKQLLVGGFEKVYEVNRNFRNEGLSTKHNPEFTALEVYQAYSDCKGMMGLMLNIVSSACKAAGVGCFPIKVVIYSDLIRERLEIEYDEENFEEIHHRYENEIEPTLMDPIFVTRFPHQAMPPLSKRCQDDDRFVDVFEFVMNGQELGCGYSEENNPDVQRQSFEAQDGEVDEDFLLALEHGMPPAGGLGLGIDRLVMALTGANSIKDVILFPQLKRR